MNKPRRARLASWPDVRLVRCWPELKPMMAEFGEELVRTLAPFAEADFPACATDANRWTRPWRGGSEGRDLIVVVLLTYTPSHVALPALISTRLPLLVFNTQQLHA